MAAAKIPATSALVLRISILPDFACGDRLSSERGTGQGPAGPLVGHSRAARNRAPPMSRCQSQVVGADAEMFVPNTYALPHAGTRTGRLLFRITGEATMV